MNDVAAAENELTPCDHCRFGLIVTGAGEREFLPQMFSAVAKRAGCSFRILRKIGQRARITEKKHLKMVRKGDVITSKDEVEIGLEARKFLRNQPCHFVILVDDVEHDRRGQLQAIWQRYRTAIDTMLSAEERQRAAVHFFANMLEAYYFAHAEAVNQALGCAVLPSDYEGDVETIRHPKGEIVRLAKMVGWSFDERRDGAMIVSRLDLAHVLSGDETCAFLRALIDWCVRKLTSTCPIWDPTIAAAFALGHGVQADLTKGQ